MFISKIQNVQKLFKILEFFIKRSFKIHESLKTIDPFFNVRKKYFVKFYNLFWNKNKHDFDLTLKDVLVKNDDPINVS